MNPAWSVLFETPCSSRRSLFSSRLLRNIGVVGLVAGGALLPLAVALDAQQRVDIQHVDRPVIARYIVVLRDVDDPLAVGVATANLSGGRLRHVYDTAINGFAVDLPEGAARALAGDPRVEYLEQDGALTLAAAQGLPSWGLDRINQHSLPLDENRQISRDGTGVHVHVVDTGIRVTHAEFGGRAFIAGDYVGDDGDGADCHGHGTHVAGTIGGATDGVAKNVTLWAHRVLDCGGAGSTSSLIAAVDAITRDSMRRPAVVNISLVAPASRALDAAIRRSIASGITYVVAAGNGDVDAAGLSPARIADAITVGASTARDRRASFSNFGTVIDLFAPGQSIVSAAIANDTASTTMSGPSTAAAHVAGVAALHLGDQPEARPADVQSALLRAATAGVLSRLGAGSPNRLLSSEAPDDDIEVAAHAAEPLAALAAAPSISLISPGGGDNWGIGSTQRIAWTHSLGAKTQMRVEVSRDGGGTWAVLASAVNNKASSGLFNWTVTGPATASALIRVSWTGGQAVGVTAAPFSIAAPFVRVTSPHGGETWVSGSTVAVEWTGNLGEADRVEIHLSTNGGGSYSTRLGRTMAVGSHSVAVQSSWLTTAAKVRVTWLNPSAVTDASDGNFRIANASAPNEPPSASLTAPANGATFTAPATITVSANASDTDGTIARVDFYQGSTLIGSDPTSPYSVAWSNVAAGSYTLTAVATDADGATTTSAARSITVTAPANQPPSVSLSAPADGATFTAPATITVSATASDPDGTIARVDFYQGSTLMGSDTTSPYSITWSNVAAASYSLTAVATDNAGATTTSAARGITVQPSTLSRDVVFGVSPDHDTLVNSYLFEIFAAGADTSTATPIASQDLGRPAEVSGESTANVTATIELLPPATYQVTVAAIGAGGKQRSLPFSFTR